MGVKVKKYWGLVILCFAILSIVIIGVVSTEKITTSASSSETYESIEIIDSVDTDFSINITSTKKIDNNNLSSYVSIQDMEGNESLIYCMTEKDYYVVSPRDGYIPGKTYKVVLNDASFLNVDYKNGLMFSVKKDDVEKAVYTNTVYNINKDIVTQIDPINKLINFTDIADYSVGDILIIPTPMMDTDFYVDTAYKVERVNDNIVSFSYPELEEVYSELEIYGNYSASEAIPYDKEYIKEQLLNNPEISSLSKALYDYKYGVKSGVSYNIKLKPYDINIEILSAKPLKASMKISWEISDRQNISLELSYDSDTVVSLSTDNDEKKQMTTNTDRWKIKLDIQFASYSADVDNIFDSLAIRNKYTKNIEENAKIDKEIEKLQEEMQKKDLEYDEINAIKSKIEEKNNLKASTNQLFGLQDKKAAYIEIKKMHDYYKSASTESDSVIKFVQLYFPVLPGAAFVVEVGAILDFSVSASFETQLVLVSEHQVGTITTKNEQVNFRNSRIDTSAYVGVIGKVDFKVGVHLGAGVTIAGIFNLRFVYQCGIYVEYSAQGGIVFGNINDLDIPTSATECFAGSVGNDKIRLAGSINYEVGTFFVLKIVASLDLWIIEVEKTWEYEIPNIVFITSKKNAEDFRELVFEEDTGITNINQLIQYADNMIFGVVDTDPTPTYEIDQQTNVVKFPNVYIRTVSGKTGDITYEYVPFSNLEFIGAYAVYFKDYFCYSLEPNLLELNNFITIKVNEDGVISDDLFLWIRFVKKPISVEKITVGLSDKTSKIGLTQNKPLDVDIIPKNATYQAHRFCIDKIVKPNGTEYTDTLSNYAYTTFSTLYTTNKIEVGSKIYVRAITNKEQISSDYFVIEVVRIDINNALIINEKNSTNINLGEEVKISLSFMPYNATINLLKDNKPTLTLDNENLAIITKIDDYNYKIKATSDSKYKDQKVKIQVSAENFTQNFYYYIVAIPIKTIEIYNATTNLLLAPEIKMNQGSSIDLKININPSDAFANDVKYNVTANQDNFAQYYSLDNQGRLTILQNAPVGLVIQIGANSTFVQSVSHSFTVVAFEINEILLSAERDYIIKGKSAKMIVDVLPHEADYSKVTYKILNSVAGVAFLGSSLRVSSSAEVNALVQVVAIIDGIQSNVLEIYILGHDPENNIIIPNQDSNNNDDNNFYDELNDGSKFITDKNIL